MDAAKQVKQHILIALQSFETGGAERQASYLARGVKAKGYQVTVLAFGKRRGHLPELLESYGVDIISTNFPYRLLLDSRGSLKAFLLKVKYEVVLIGLVRKIKPHVIVPFTYPSNFIFSNLSRRLGVSKIFWNQRDAGFGFQGKPREKKLLEKVSALITNSQEGKNFLRQYTSRSIHHIPNGIEVPEYFNIKGETKHKELRIVMVANLHRNKDHMTLLKAWKKLIQDGQSELILFLAGREDDSAQTIKSYIQENNLEQTVKLLGAVKDVYSLLSSCHLAVFSSYKEGLPNGVLECMAAGLPVVATRITGTIEALGDDYPYLAEPGNPVDLAEKIGGFLADEDLRNVIGTKNRERVRREFGMEKMVESYINLIERN